MAKKKNKIGKKKMDFIEQMAAEGKVLVAKVGHEEKFLETLGEMHKIGHGALGWDGQAEMMYELGMVEVLKKEGVKFPRGKAAQITKLRQIVIGSFVDKLYQFAEWIPEKEAESRNQYRTILYKEDPNGPEKVPASSGVDDTGKP